MLSIIALSHLGAIFIHCEVTEVYVHTCRPEFYYECDWNGARIIVIVQQTKK